MDEDFTASRMCFSNLPSLSGWGELPSVQPKSEPAWGEPAAPTSTVDNGTSAWGKPPGGVGGWGDSSHEPSGPYGRANGPPGSAPCKTGIAHRSIIIADTGMYKRNSMGSHC